MGRLADRLGELGVGRIAAVAKCRPDAMTGPLLRFLKERLGLVRLYVGVENFSPAGLEHLGRGLDRETVERGLTLCSEADLYCCYNVLLFEPDTVLDDVRENIRGMERFPDVPVNFSRTEAYNGTAVWAKLKREGRLRGNYLYAGYRIEDPAVEALFAIVSQAFKDRNFSPEALANMNSSLGYEMAVLRFFAGGGGGRRLADLAGEVRALNAAVNADTLSNLKAALDFVEKGKWKDRGSTADFTMDLGRKVNFAGAEYHSRLLELRQEINALT
jgi:anaerobic magnesium-protoporphyrin IX monomethyl ester cyclase